MTGASCHEGHPDPVLELVDRALRMPVDQRASYIDRTEQDPRIRDEALAVLRAVSTVVHDEGDAPPEGPSIASTLIGVPIGDFRPVRAIGCGAGGIVYEAEQRMPRRSVAVKVLRPQSSAQLVAQRLESESRALAALGHPSIVAVHAAGVATLEGFGPIAWMAMELVAEARTSTEHARQSGNVREVLRIFAAFAEALGAAHRAGLVHRDVKPANLLVSSSGTAKVVDFGLATVDGGERVPVGTRGYLAPERRDGGAATACSDVWSLGVCLADALRAARVPRRHPAWAIAGHACSDDPAHRYPDAASMAADVRAAREGSAIRALRRDPIRAAIHRGAARPRVLAVVAVFLVVVGVASWWAWSALRGSDTMMLLGAQRILSMHGEMTEAIGTVRPEDRPAAIDRAFDRGMRACARSTLDAEVAFISASAILKLGDADRACEFASRASRDLAALGAKEAERTWIDLFAVACEARSSPGDDQALTRFIGEIESIAGSSRASDFLLACYVYAVTLQVDEPGFRDLIPDLLGRARLDPESSVTGAVIMLVAAAEPGIPWMVPGRADSVLRVVERWTREPLAGYLAPVLVDLMIDVLPACARSRDLPRFEAIAPALRLASRRTGSTERVLLADGYLAAYERAFGLIDRASTTLDAMAAIHDAAGVPPGVFGMWLPERIKLALRAHDPRGAVMYVVDLVGRAPWVAAPDPVLSEAVRACAAGNRQTCESLLGEWLRARPASFTPAQRADDEWMVASLLEVAAPGD
jgi:hypothetical protein